MDEINIVNKCKAHDTESDEGDGRSKEEVSYQPQQVTPSADNGTHDAKRTNTTETDDTSHCTDDPPPLLINHRRSTSSVTSSSSSESNEEEDVSTASVASGSPSASDEDNDASTESSGPPLMFHRPVYDSSSSESTFF